MSTFRDQKKQLIDQKSIRGYGVEIDHNKFTAINLAIDTMQLGGLAGTAFNAAKEQSLDLFIEGKIKFLEMFKFVEIALIEYKNNKTDYYSSVEQVIEQDKHTRGVVYKAFESLKYD